MNKVNIGIIGRGFVGSAVEFGFGPQTGCDWANLKVFDIDPLKSINSFEETINESDFIFVSLPTPSNEDNSINVDILFDAFKDIDNINKRDDNIFLVRSTVVPGTTNSLIEKYKNLDIIFSQEFLTFFSFLYHHKTFVLHQYLPHHHVELVLRLHLFRDGLLSLTSPSHQPVLHEPYLPSLTS